MFLNKISKTPGILTPFDDKFDKDLEYPVALAWEARRDHGIAHTHQTRGVAIDSVISSKSKSSGLGAYTESKEHEAVFVLPPKRPEDSVVTPEQARKLRTLISSGQVMTLSYGNLYQAAVFNGNLLHARTTPNVVIIPKTIKEIQDTIGFARKNRIELTVKNGGHSFAGYCLNYGGILINMESFGPKEIKFNLDSTPKTVTIPAGCRWRDVYKRFEDEGRAELVLGGRCASVGVSGFTMGGGVSPFSRCYGLGIDSVLSFRLITADGKDVTVSRDDTCERKRNLFWALQGGGGGNFGVLVEFTTKLHDLANGNGMVIYETLTWKFPEGQSKFEEMIDKLNSKDQPWPNELAMDVLWQEDQGQLIVVYDGTEEKYRKDIRSLKNFGGESRFKLCKWWEVAVQEQGWSPESPAFHHHTSFIFGNHALTSDVVSTVNKIMEELRVVLSKNDPNGKAYLIWVHVGGKTSEVGAKDTAFFWRGSSYVSYFKLQWYDRHATNAMIDYVGEVKEKLLQYTIQGKAAYVNFTDPTIPNWQEAYYGDNYSRLQQIKEDWDSDDFFHFEQSIKLPGAKDADSHTGTGKDLENAIKRTKDHWDAHSLPNPGELWNLNDPLGHDVLKVIGKQCVL
ncbi:unnamed protein product [Rhizoctonia solani]|uniref:FAD-binding PCMH-type domain-containing protein n=1 Tax=Rhizoctonia solani TaxID=456999 RepID=A0A8H2WB76_9AGAM|nr:unnamed protein product [Rhizoctonia solani]